MSKIKKTTLLTIVSFAFLVPLFAYAVDPYVPIEEIPLVGKQTEITAYLRGIFQFGVAAIAIVSMVVMMIGGYLYIFSAGGKTEKAKNMITNALLGLGLALTSWIIVYTINPDLVELKGIQNVNINVVNRGAIGNVTSGVGVDISDKCSIQEAKWESTSAFLGNPSTLVFNLPQDCVENKDITALSVTVTIQTYRVEQASPDIDIANLNFNRSSGQLVSDPKYPFVLKAQWSIPASSTGVVREGDNLSFIAESHFVMKNNNNLSSGPKNSSNKLEILPTRLTGTCEISKARWEDGAVFSKNASGALERVQAVVAVTVSPSCNTVQRIANYALRVKLYVGSTESHRPETLVFNSRFVNFPNSSGNTVRVSYDINARNLADIRYKVGDWFYVKTAIVKAQDTGQQIFPSRTTVDSGNISEAHPQEL